MTLETIPISRRAADQVKRGYLWIFANEISGKMPPLKPGSWCHFESGGNIVGTGYFNPHSLIAGRVVGFDKRNDIETLLEERLEAAFKKRLFLTSFGSFRLVFSESDFLPGLILDHYSGTCVLQANTAGIDEVLPLLIDLIPRVFSRVFKHLIRDFVVRGDSSIRKLEGILEHGQIAMGTQESVMKGVFQEDTLKMAANFWSGQKTGYFLDQRDNRFAFGAMVKGEKWQSVLDLFCYSGGWGLHALKNGATKVVFVDQSVDALNLAHQGLNLNQFRRESAEFVESDVFDFLEKDASMYDVVVADPPAFVKSKKVLPQAKKAYEKLARLSWRRVKPGGMLFFSSCSYHLAEEDLLELLKNAAAKENSFAHIVYRGGQPEDHPVLLSMPETRYLKCFGLRKL